MSDTNKQIYYDGSVGIGTQNPTQSLDVTGKVKIGDDNAPPSAGTMRFANGGFEGFDGRSWESFTTSGQLAPQAKLDIHEGDIRLHKKHLGNNKNSWEQHLLFTDEMDRLGARITGRREQWDGAPMGLSFHTGGVNHVTEQMTIGSNGNVGIGTTTPVQKLDVRNGTVYVGKSNDINGVNPNLKLLINNTNSQNNHGHNHGVIGWVGHKRNNGTNLSASIGAISDSWDDQGHLVFSTSKDGAMPREAMRITSHGNVGIGIAAPLHKLDVNGTVNAKQFLVDGKPLPTGGSSNLSGDDIVIGSRWWADNQARTVTIGKPGPAGQWDAGSAYIRLQDANQQAGVNAGTSIAFFTHQWGAGTHEALRIAANGNVGIGTATPVQKLDVRNGTVYVGKSNDINGVNPNLKLLINNTNSQNNHGHNHGVIGWVGHKRNNGANLSASIGAISDSWDDQGHLVFSTSKDGAMPREAMRITSHGNVGIGTVTPHANFRLQVKDGDNSWKGGIAAGGQTAAVVMGELSNVATLGAHNGALDAWASLAINPYGGNVGIGTLAPAQKLDVNGNIKCINMTQTSDGRLKKAVKTMQDALEKVTTLRGVTYQWKDSAMGTTTEAGLIAQEVEKIFPEVVATDNEGNKSIAYSKMIAPLIEAIKEQQRQIEALQRHLLNS